MKNERAPRTMADATFTTGYATARRTRNKMDPRDRSVIIWCLVALVALVAILWSERAQAQPFVEVGVGTLSGGCLADGWEWRQVRGQWNLEQRCSGGPLGLAAIGYATQLLPFLPGAPRVEVRWDHWSSIPNGRDRGIDIVSARLRWEF